jgi:hypothetical protein
MADVASLTFPLAIAGYAGLTAAVVLGSRGPAPPWLLRLTAAVVAAHVGLVWSVRYEWQFAVATRNGYAGFAIFHAALALIVASAFLPASHARRLVTAAFAVVTLGAWGAVFRYAEVAAYRFPVLALSAMGAGALIGAIRRRGPNGPSGYRGRTT